MSYYNISNFKAGLDTRRNILASLAGTLQVLNNCHITQGGEIEKRMGFFLDALPANTFGLEKTDEGVITFGSDADPGGWPIGAVVAYQRLQHPTGLFDMTEVVASQNFQGNALVLAKFSDGNSFLYYDGELVTQSSYGVVLSGLANQQAINDEIARQIVEQIMEHPGWDGIALGNTAVWGTGDSNSLFYIVAPDAITFTYSVDSSTVAGGISLTDQMAFAPVVGSAGTASFTVSAVTGTYTIQVMNAVTGGTLITLVDALPWVTSDNQTATYIAASINAKTGETGFSAAAVGAVVTVTNPLLTKTATAAFSGLTYMWPSLTVTAASDPGANGPHAFSLSNYEVTASGQYDLGLVYGPWLVGDTWQLTIDPSTGDSFVLGAGNINSATQLDATNVFVDRQRAFLANHKRVNFSAINDPAGWEDYNTGAGFFLFTSQYGVEDGVVAFSTYIGQLAVFGRRSIQLWATPATPADFSLQQTLNNIGTFARLSVQSLGDAESLFLSDTGIRSLKQREYVQNAFVDDIGSPIDLTVQNALQGASDAAKAAACAIVEPTQNRYWLYLDGVIYVLSYFPTSKIVAWSTYSPTYDVAGTQIEFVPQKFLVSGTMTYARTANAIVAFGGDDGQTYDNCIATAQTPFQAGGGSSDKPATNKVAKAIAVTMQDSWDVQVSTDWVDQTFESAFNSINSSYDKGFIPIQMQGTHFAFKATSQAASAAKLCQLTWLFEEGEEQG